MPLYSLRNVFALLGGSGRPRPRKRDANWLTGVARLVSLINLRTVSKSVWPSLSINTGAAAYRKGFALRSHLTSIRFLWRTTDTGGVNRTSRQPEAPP